MATSPSEDVYNIDNHTIPTNNSTKESDNSTEEQFFTSDNTIDTINNLAPTHSLPCQWACIR